ncbi:hypothetical protein QOZ80_2BG0201010 [Eleusine coracana subsp. coracana]|nr:hypothetical protein QOZ80_2BG0201010 [Eleusine coracana subsp. coracana]
MYLPAFRVWFARRPPPLGVRVQLLAVSDFPFLNNASSSPVLARIEEDGERDVAMLDYLRFYLPEMFPALRRVVLLEDDVVVQRDLAGLWHVDMGAGAVNAAVHTCFGGFRRYGKYLNFSDPFVRERFSPRACAWSYGVNVFDLQAWRREQCTQQFHSFMEMNENGTLWDRTSVLPAGLMTFYGKTKPLDKSWHVMGLGLQPAHQARGHPGSRGGALQREHEALARRRLQPVQTPLDQPRRHEMEFLTLCNFGL